MNYDSATAVAYCSNGVYPTQIGQIYETGVRLYDSYAKCRLF